MPIGFYQFDNLIQQRVPFFLFSAVDLSKLNYIGVEKMHLGQVTTAVDTTMGLNEIIMLIQEKGLPLDAPLVFVCEDGEWSKRIADELQNLKYINSFYALGGLNELLKGP